MQKGAKKSVIFELALQEKGAEFLSGFSKCDKIKPVITLTVYFNEGDWDGPRSLHEMFHTKNEKILRYVSDYKLNLLVPKEVEQPEKFRTNLRYVMEYMKAEDDKKVLEQLCASFRVCKFRSMIQNADQMGGGTTALHDPRITKTGNILRKTKLDEIPQIGQVFLGKMSLIGPRPELLRYVEQYEGEEKDILQVRPGITDFSSIEFINLDEIVGGEHADEMYEKYVLKKKNQLRVKYAHSVSFGTDVFILFRTLGAVFRKAFGFLVKKEHQ